jgi:hypothetical protein
MNPVQASKAVLIEVMNVLGRYRDHLILVGGWVPELLLPNRGYMGSLDVDPAAKYRSSLCRGLLQPVWTAACPSGEGD